MRRTLSVLVVSFSVLALIAGPGGARGGLLRQLLGGGGAKTQAAPDPGLQQATLNFQGVDRSYYVHVPASVQGQASVPLLFVFHGGQGNGSGVAATSQMDSMADAMGFVVIYPDSHGKQWNDGRSTTASDVDDVGFVRALIGVAVQSYNVDPGRVFAAGISNGGIFTQRLACDASDAIRGFGVVSANLPADYQSACHPARAVPMVFFNGTTDAMMPWDGGDVKSFKLLGLGAGGAVLSHDATEAFWTGANGCGAASVVQNLPDADTGDGTTVSEQDFRRCAGGTQMRFFTITGGGHNWPGSAGSGSRMQGNVSQDISATAQITSFFGAYGL